MEQILKNIRLETHYYPSGLPMDISSGSNAQPALKFIGKEMDLQHGIVETDLGARGLIHHYGRFGRIDPLAEKYYAISPYAYSANNFPNFKDSNGKWIVGTDGKPVSFEKGVWSKNASADVQRIGNAMSDTKEGKTVLNNMLSSKDKIAMNYCEGFHPDQEQRNVVGQTIRDRKTGSITINLYDGKIKEEISQFQTVSEGGFHFDKELDEIGQLLLEQVPSLRERIGQVGAHEGTHATDPKAMPHNYKGTKTERRNQAEPAAKASELRAIQQTVRPLKTEVPKLKLEEQMEEYYHFRGF